MKPSVSFLTVVFKEDLSLVKRCFSSLLAQSYTNFNIIVVLNSERPDVLNHIKDLNSDKFLIKKMSENVGLTKALNEGLNLIESEFVARIDPDDFCLPHRLASQVEFFEQNPGYVLVGCAYDEIYKGQTISPNVPFVSGGLQLAESLKSFNPFAHSSLMIRTHSIKSLGGYDPKYRFAQDYDLICRISKLGKLENLKVKLIVREKSLNQISIRNRRQQLYFSMEIRSRLILGSGLTFVSFLNLTKSFVSYLLPNFLYDKIKN